MTHCFNHHWWSVLKQWGLGLLLSVGWALSIFLLSPAALATETQLQWQGDQGYQVRANLIYPDTFTTGIAAINGVGQPQHLETLLVRVYDPNGQELAVYENVAAGQSGQDNFLQLHFDVGQQQLRGWLDIGGAVGEDYFLKGQPGVGLDLFYLDAQGKETKVDHNDGQVSLVAE
ncbi:MAG: hypothetical protein VKL20_08440 [Synechocystis sp.]|nr:hypothetical protein [Synechocystis sp.]